MTHEHRNTGQYYAVDAGLLITPRGEVVSPPGMNIVGTHYNYAPPPAGPMRAQTASRYASGFTTPSPDTRVPIKEVGHMLGAKDARTIARRLDELGVPVLKTGNRRLVKPSDVEKGLRRAERVGGSDRPVSGGITLPPGQRVFPT